MFPAPPIDHLDELLGAWESGVYYELNRVLSDPRQFNPYDPDDGRLCFDPRPEWEYLYILEPTTDAGFVSGGYAHVHVAVVVDGPVEDGRFGAVMDRHVGECPGASAEAHEVGEAVEVKSLDEFDNPGAYLFKYLGKSWDTEEMEDYERRFNALIFDQDRRRFRASDGGQRWMKRDEEGFSGDWRFVGVADSEEAARLSQYEDGEEFRVANELSPGAWLSGYTSVGVEIGWEELGYEWLGHPERCEGNHVWVRGECRRCGVVDKSLFEWGGT